MVSLELSSWLGPLLARLRLNSVAPRHAVDGSSRLAKRRRCFARWLIPIGNGYLRWLRAGVQVLPDGLWQAREIEVQRRLYGVECTVDDRGWLLLPLWPGRLAADYCADISVPLEERLRALAAVVRSLRELHEISVSDGPLCHGDATLRNVIYDPNLSNARWIDFDTVHEPAELLCRQADDVRADLYSALEVVRDASVETILETVRTGYDDASVWRHLRDLLRNGPIHAGAFHLAQAAPSVSRRRELERRIFPGR